MKIAVYTIAKNEEKFIERWASSCVEADLRLVLDTGSSDLTVQKAAASGCTVHSASILPWRFDDARNVALSLIPPDYDYCIALDADEILIEGWRNHLESIDPSITRPRYKYVWSWNGDSSEGLVYSGDKIHSRNGYRWKHPVHEVLKPSIEEVQGWIDLQIHHYPDSNKSRSQYLPLLELSIKEDPNDDRNRFYLGREYMFAGLNEQAEQQLLKYLEISSWKPERATAMRYLSRVSGERYHWLLRACAESPDRREPWIELAGYYYVNSRWIECLSAVESALTIKEKPLEYLCEAESWGSHPYDMATVAAWNVGMRELAIEYCKSAVAIEPNNERFSNNLKTMLENST